MYMTLRKWLHFMWIGCTFPHLTSNEIGQKMSAQQTQRHTLHIKPPPDEKWWQSIKISIGTDDAFDTSDDSYLIYISLWFKTIQNTAAAANIFKLVTHLQLLTSGKKFTDYMRFHRLFHSDLHWTGSNQIRSACKANLSERVAPNLVAPLLEGDDYFTCSGE